MNIEMRATPGPGLRQLKKKIWLGFQQEKKKKQIYGVANLISKHERGRKRREIGVTLDNVTTYVWFKSLKLCLAILLYYMDD